jgi:hypothetical protein
MVYGWLIKMGLSDWRPIYDWAIQSTLSRTGHLADTGWPRAHSTAYNQIVRETSSAPVVRSWAESYAMCLEGDASFAYEDENTWVVHSTGYTYLMYTYAALNFAHRNGIALGDRLTWADGQIDWNQTDQPYTYRFAMPSDMPPEPEPPPEGEEVLMLAVVRVLGTWPIKRR